jgi:hypothetical protein
MWFWLSTPSSKELLNIFNGAVNRFGRKYKIKNPTSLRHVLMTRPCYG